MSTDTTWQTDSTSLEATELLGAELGRRLRGGEVIELVSDLGGGKTALVRGIAQGMGSPDVVASPSFTISREYKAGQQTLYHFDFYRLSDPGIMQNELVELLTDPQATLVIEWADLVENLLPTKRLQIIITATGDASRHIVMNYPDSLAYLVPKAETT